MRILIVEDESDLADVVARGLRQAGLAVDVALDGEEGLEKATITPYEVVVLDRGRRGSPVMTFGPGREGGLQPWLRPGLKTPG